MMYWYTLCIILQYLVDSAIGWIDYRLSYLNNGDCSNFVQHGHYRDYNKIIPCRWDYYYSYIIIVRRRDVR